MEPVRTLIVDDEKTTREDLVAFIRKDPALVVAGECADGLQALQVLQSGTIDLLLLDIQLPSMNAFALLNALAPEKRPVTVLVTAHGEYALQAFKTHVADYLLKPFTENELREVLTHGKESVKLARLRESRSELIAILAEDTAASTSIHAHTPPRPGASPPPGGSQRIAISASGKIHFVDHRDIYWIEAADNYIKLHTAKDIHVVRDTLADVEIKLDASKFVRIHRSAVVNIDFIAELQPYFMGEYVAILRDGTKLRVSRNRRKQFRRLMNLR
jgi:two-component system LytT family response regulator